mmetsp:Transcript_114114/g.285481  ORF Transcript_114114/g.285481 Transcript_114114/m.285481 type:complete len:139 (-) Transcript_114114:74-490(-)
MQQRGVQGQGQQDGLQHQVSAPRPSEKDVQPPAASILHSDRQKEAGTFRSKLSLQLPEEDFSRQSTEEPIDARSVGDWSRQTTRESWESGIVSTPTGQLIHEPTGLALSVKNTFVHVRDASPTTLRKSHSVESRLRSP